MKKPTHFQRCYLSEVLFAFLLILTFFDSATSQRLGIAHEDYMKAIGWEDDFIVMKNILQNELTNRIEDKPAEYYNDNANFFSMVLLLTRISHKYFV